MATNPRFQLSVRTVPHISHEFDVLSQSKATMKFLLYLLATTATSMSFAQRQFGLASRTTTDQALKSLYNPEQYLDKVLLHLAAQELKNGNVTRAKTLMNKALGRVATTGARSTVRKNRYVHNKRRQQQQQRRA